MAVPLCWALPDPLSLPHFLARIQNLLPMSTALVCQCPKAGQPSLSLRAVHEGQTRVFILPASRLQHWQKGLLQGVGRGPVSCSPTSPSLLALPANLVYLANQQGSFVCIYCTYLVNKQCVSPYTGLVQPPSLV